MSDLDDRRLVQVKRIGNFVRVTFEGYTGAEDGGTELRTVVLGLWARFDEETRADMITEFAHYQERGLGGMPLLARAVAMKAGDEPPVGARAVDYRDGGS